MSSEEQEVQIAQASQFETIFVKEWA
jgi:hypothetical protein